MPTLIGDMIVGPGIFSVGDESPPPLDPLRERRRASARLEVRKTPLYDRVLSFEF